MNTNREAPTSRPRYSALNEEREVITADGLVKVRDLAMFGGSSKELASNTRLERGRSLTCPTCRKSKR